MHLASLLLSGSAFSNEELEPTNLYTSTFVRHQSAFARFFDLAHERGLTFESNLEQQVAGVLLDFNNISTSQARSAYPALWYIPRVEGLKCQPLLSRVRRESGTVATHGMWIFGIRYLSFSS